MTILKILGIILLSILALVLLVVLLILFAPLRYHLLGDVDFKKSSEEGADSVKKYHIRMTAGWVLHLIHFSDSLNEQESNRMQLRILGIPLFRNKDKKKTDRKKDKPDKKKKDRRENQNPVKEDTKQQENIPAHDRKETLPEPLPKVQIEQKAEQESVPAKTDVYAEDKQKENKPKRHIFRQIRTFFIRLWNGIKSFFGKLKNAFQMLKKTCKKIHSIWEFATDVRTKQAVALCRKELKYLWKHFKPRSGRCDLCFGTGDPAYTGEALAVLALFSGHLGKKMYLYPDFENLMLKGSFSIKGHIRLIHLLIAFIKLYFDDNLKQVIKSSKQL